MVVRGCRHGSKQFRPFLGDTVPCRVAGLGKLGRADIALFVQGGEDTQGMGLADQGVVLADKDLTESRPFLLAEKGETLALRAG